MTCTSLTQCNILNLQSSAIDEFNDIEFNEFDQPPAFTQPAPAFTQPAPQLTQTEIDAQNYPNVLAYKAINLYKPENDLKWLMEQIEKTESRPLPDNRILTALHCLSFLAMKREIKGIRGAKPNLITLLVAPTGAGKEAGHSFIKEFARCLGMLGNLYGNISSGKDMILNLFESDGKTTYLIDEAHSLIVAAMDKDAPAYAKIIPDEIMKMSTTNLYAIAGNHKREIEDSIKTKITRLQKRVDAAKENEHYGSPDDEIRSKERGEVKGMEAELEALERVLITLKEGIRNPYANFHMTSTPVKFDTVISGVNIDSGFVGRVLVRRQESALEAPWREECEYFESREILIKEFINKALFDEHRQPRTDTEINMSPDVLALLKEWHYFCEEPVRRDDPFIGGLWRRGAERVNALVSIMNARSMNATRYDILYAIKLTIEHIETCAYLAMQNTSSSALATGVEVLEAVKAKAVRIITEAGAKGIYFSTLKQNVIAKGNKRVKDAQAECARANQCLLTNVLAGVQNIKVDGSRYFILQ